jgi:O-acetylhomoserine/O-acetylserine sulfhydrylase-like pyridoxal-dependent enzyme
MEYQVSRSRPTYKTTGNKYYGGILTFNIQDERQQDAKL